jgi:hypothetical protein
VLALLDFDKCWTQSYRPSVFFSITESMEPPLPTGICPKFKPRIIAAWLCLAVALPALGFEKLTDAQTWIYDKGHLANTVDGQTVTYHYESADTQSSVVEDSATLTIVKSQDEEHRDVELDFLSDTRHLPLPAFNGYRGNPIIIAMLEHIAQNMGNETGGGALYFRNRIRDALAAEDVNIESGLSQYDTHTIRTTVVSFLPFSEDTYLDKDSVFRDARFALEFSDEVPGGLVKIGVVAKSSDRLFRRELVIQ